MYGCRDADVMKWCPMTCRLCKLCAANEDCTGLSDTCTSVGCRCGMNTSCSRQRADACESGVCRCGLNAECKEGTECISGLCQDASGYCVKIKTGTEPAKNGTLHVEINDKVAADGYYGLGTMVIDTCFAFLNKMTITNPLNDDWSGQIAIRYNGKPTSITCEECSGLKLLTNGNIVVDGSRPWTGSYIKVLPDSQCLNGHTCALTWVVEDELWSEVATNMTCNEYTYSSPVTKQQECQTNCLQDPQCVGITKSHQYGLMPLCGICKDDSLTKAQNGFGFYRRPACSLDGECVNGWICRHNRCVSAFRRISSGNCDSKGMKMITSIKKCEEGARRLNLKDTTVFQNSNKQVNGRPYGCILATDKSAGLEWLTFASPYGHPYGNIPCGTRYDGLTSQCICSVPECVLDTDCPKGVSCHDGTCLATATAEEKFTTAEPGTHRSRILCYILSDINLVRFFCIISNKFLIL